MDKNAALKRICDSLKISRYEAETDQLFLSRLLYSALGMWCFTFAGQGEKEDELLTKGDLHRQLAKVLDTYTLSYPFIIGWFTRNNNFDAINSIRDTLLRSGDLCEYGFGSKVCISEPTNLQYTGDRALFLGRVDIPKTGEAAGLAWIINSEGQCDLDLIFERFGIPSKSSSDFLKECLNYAKWNELSNIDSYEIFDYKRNAVFSACWAKHLPMEAGIVYLTRRQLSFGPFEYGLITQKEKRMYCYKLPEVYQNEQIRDTQRLLYALKSCYKENARATVEHYEVVSIWHFWSKLPPAEENLLRYIGWPLQDIVNTKNEYVVRNEFAEIMQRIVNNLGIQLEENHHG